jgi:hypothetical protein
VVAREIKSSQVAFLWQQPPTTIASTSVMVMVVVYLVNGDPLGEIERAYVVRSKPDTVLVGVGW